MPPPSPDSVSALNVLPAKVKADVNVQQRLADLVEALRTSSDVHGFGGQIRITLEGVQMRPAPSASENRSRVMGGSPGDWYENQDQMTHGGRGNGGNWTTD